jgi:hypothetical protein
MECHVTNDNNHNAHNEQQSVATAKQLLGLPFRVRCHTSESSKAQQAASSKQQRALAVQ